MSISNIPFLTSFSAVGTEINAAAIRAFATKNVLTSLDAGYQNAHEGVLEAICEIKSLEFLDLSRSADVTDENVLDLCRLPRLQKLFLRSCMRVGDFTAAGVEKLLTQHHTLKFLGLAGNGLTSAAVSALQAKSKCVVRV